MQRSSISPNNDGEVNIITPAGIPMGYSTRQNNVTDDLDVDQDGTSFIEVLAVAGSFIVLALTFPFCLIFIFKVVKEYERAVIFRMGRVRTGAARGPGVFFVLPCVDDYRSLDLRVISFDVPPQEILTRDSVTVSVDAVVYYRVVEPKMAFLNVNDYSRSTRLLASTTLRTALGTKNLAELLSDRNAISQSIQSMLDAPTKNWGVLVERVELKDVRLPSQLQRAMAAEAEASREARAKVIAAEGEMKASRSLKDASDIMMTSPSALQLRYLQSLTSIASERNSTILFPIPIDIMSSYLPH